METLKHKCLSSVAKKFRGIKTKLTSRYVFGSKKNENTLLKYTWIDEDIWCQFVELRTSEGWQVYLFEIINYSIDNFVQFELIHKVGFICYRKREKRLKV